MASLSPLSDLGEKFFLCSICLEQFKEPKLLPCLHRYCSDCLKTLVEGSIDGTIKCPICQHECDVPENGINGFKTDFHSKSILEFIDLQKSCEKEDLQRICVSCSKRDKVSAYCFKCRDFLCCKCCEVHVSNKMFTDHQPHILKLDNVKGKKLTLEKLTNFQENPRCDVHLYELALLCCKSCQNAPVCIACTYGDHKGHDLHEVTKMASNEKELLKSKVSEVDFHKRKLCGLNVIVEAVRVELHKNVTKTTKELTNQYTQQTSKLKAKLAERKYLRKKGLSDIDKRRHVETINIHLNFEEEYDHLKEKYDTIAKTTARKYDNESKTFLEQCTEIEKEVSKQIEDLDSAFLNIKKATTFFAKRNQSELQEISDYCKQIMTRYENLTTMTSSILASKDNWMVVHCIPDIRAACEPLIQEMTKEYPMLQSLSDLRGSGMKTSLIDVVIGEDGEDLFSIEELKVSGLSITGITDTVGGNIVITGAVSDEYSHITVVDSKGKIKKQERLRMKNAFGLYPHRYCCHLSQFKLTTICKPDEIGIYDVRDSSYNKKYISDVIRKWRCVCSVTTDPVTNQIIVGTDSRFVYLFDDKLNYSHTITMPDVISGSHDITVHTSGNLLVCTYIGAFAVTVAESNSTRLLYEFSKPDFPGDTCIPISVCTDRNGYIYILWNALKSGESKRILVQYSQDGRHLMTSRFVDLDVSCMNVSSESDGNENLFLASREKGKVSRFQIIETINCISSERQHEWSSMPQDGEEIYFV